MQSQVAPEKTGTSQNQTVFSILFAISFSHMLNDTIQSLIPAIYPIIKDSFHLSFSQIGIITFAFQLSASVLQPFVGFYTDKKPRPFSLVLGMSFSLVGLLLLSSVSSYALIIPSVCLIGIGSAIFHPEASRIAYMASGSRRGLGQSIFQVGGNAGSSLGPLLAALIIVPFGRGSLSWFSVLAFAAIIVLWRVGVWYGPVILHRKKNAAAKAEIEKPKLSRQRVILSVSILLLLIFSKYIYMTSMTSYFTFYLIEKFAVSVQTAQFYLFIFLASIAAGTLLGGPIGDRIGRKYVIWASILGVAPFTLALPYANLFWTGVLIVPIGIILASAFSAILVYAQELIPGKVGTISGLFFGFAFGIAGIGSAMLGWLADETSIAYVYKLCTFLPFIGLLTALLPDTKQIKRG
ncbi:MAG: MFS transporter [Sphingobacteriales bacterium]|nr:MAG: MFS transporter [Sphingobacteriales bacterium]